MPGRSLMTPGTEELMARLSQLEERYNRDSAAAREREFMDAYGSRFSNNHSLGVAILDELDARGIDTSAADEAVQEILDSLRIDCQTILDMITQAQDVVIENTKKVEQVANVVSEAVANNPYANIPNSAPPLVESAEMPPEMTDAEELNMEGIGAPEGEQAASTQTGQAEQSEQATSTQTGQAEQSEQAEQPVGNTTVSDARMKRIERVKNYWSKPNTTVSDARMKRVERIKNYWNKR